MGKRSTWPTIGFLQPRTRCFGHCVAGCSLSGPECWTHVSYVEYSRVSPSKPTVWISDTFTETFGAYHQGMVFLEFNLFLNSEREPGGATLLSALRMQASWEPGSAKTIICRRCHSDRLKHRPAELMTGPPVSSWCLRLERSSREPAGSCSRCAFESQTLGEHRLEHVYYSSQEKDKQTRAGPFHR